jgi:hypothetical protein
MDSAMVFSVGDVSSCFTSVSLSSSGLGDSESL